MRAVMQHFRNCAGSATVEFALIATSVIAVLPLIWDIANVTNGSMALNGGLRAGMQYALTSPSDSAGIAQVTQTASGFSSGVSTTSPQTCTCSGQSVACGSTCAGGGTPAKYVTITASYSVPTLLPYTGFPSNAFPISSSVVVRVQ